MNIDLRTSVHGAYRENHLTASAEAPVIAGGLRSVFDDVAAVLAREGIEPIAEKIYGAADARVQILRARREALRARRLDVSTPVTFVSGTPACGGSLAGIQLWGVAQEGPATTVRTVAAGPAPAGRLWSAPGFRLLHIPGVRGVTPSSTLPQEATRQAQRMFHNAAAGAAANGFRYVQTVRTWIYVARLLDWYEEFNRVRSDFYATRSFGHEQNGPAFPASTGIQGRSADEECLMDVLLFDAKDPSVARARAIDRTSRQGPAPAYGSAFSRAMTIELAGRRTLHVSGTASIDSDGRSMHPGEPDAQCLETLLSVAAVIEQQGGSLSNISSATLFCKNAETYAAYRQAKTLLGIPSFPTVCVIADVCRPELLVELEAVANL